jgi:hypothetical protein
MFCEECEETAINGDYSSENMGSAGKLTTNE